MKILKWSAREYVHAELHNDKYCHCLTICRISISPQNKKKDMAFGHVLFFRLIPSPRYFA